MGTENGKRASRRVAGFLVPFFTNTNWLFCIPKGTPYSCHCLFELRKIVD
jgi:hypothetical protein